ncbi:MAG TPA: TolC family outer membrane protein [Stellaceae bacterium]|nr:TolC family outer membrane protein [Stellaceae bacterium]
MSADEHAPDRSAAGGPVRRDRRIGGAALLGLLMACAAPAAAAETLTDALAYAYYNNPALLAQRALLRATDELVPQALSNWRPTVTFSGQTGFSNNAALPTFPHTPNTYVNLRPSSLGLHVDQPIYRGGRTEAQTRQAINTVEAQRAQTLATETTVFQAVVKAYLDVVRDQTLVQVDRNNEAVLRQQLAATEARFRVGEVTRTDVAQAEASLAQATATRIAAEGTLETSRAEYVHAVGHPPGRLVFPRDVPALPASRREALELAAHSNFSVIAANFTELAARDNVDLVRGQLLPQISVVGDLTRAKDVSTILKGVWERTVSITAQMTMPLYEGGAIYSQTRQAEQTVGQRLSQVDDARRAAVETATDNWETLRSDRASIASFEAAVRAAQIALAGVQQEALVGTATTLDVLVQNQTLFTVESQLVVAQHDAALAAFNVAAATGRLIAPELKLPVKLYDMDRHYREVKDKWIGFRGGLSE